MKARALLWLSLGLNLLLAVLMVSLSREAARDFGAQPALARNANLPREIRTNVVLRRQYFDWSQIESQDYPQYIRNLRRIGCPEKTIRDIIVADVSEVFLERQAKEIVLPEQQWWLPEPNMDVFEAAANQLRALEAEKTALLDQLLGPSWNPRSPHNRSDPVRLDGPVLSKLAPETRAKLFQVEADARRAREAYLKEVDAAKKQADPAELARLRLQTRNELAALLAPQELEEYLLRYSLTADSLRGQLRGYGADSDEFRRIFRARDSYDDQIAALTGTDPASARRRAELERERDAALRQTLGPERFPLYQLTQNPLFKEAQEQAEQSGAPAEKVLPIFQIQQLSQAEIARIEAATELSSEEKRAAVLLIQEQQQASIRKIVSGEAAPE